MENPDTWDLLTSHLAVSDLSHLDFAWKFLVEQDLVLSTPEARTSFLKLVQEEIDRGDVTGPSVAARAAGRLQDAGIARPGSEAPDPWGRIAKGRRAT